MTRLSIDLEVMLGSYKGHKFILVFINEVANFMETIPIHQLRSQEMDDALIEFLFSKYSIPECMIMDQDSVFMSTFINYLFKKLGIKINMVATYNHQSLQAEFGINYVLEENPNCLLI